MNDIESTTPRYEKGARNKLIRFYDRKGKAPIKDTFLERRAAMSWKTAGKDGYFSIFGVKQIIHHKGKYPLEILAEKKFDDQDRMFRAVVVAMKLLDCKIIYADCSKEYESNTIEFARFLNKYGHIDIWLYDASEFDGWTATHGGFKAASIPIDELGTGGLLLVKDSKILGNELKSIQPDIDHNETRCWENFPAIHALNHIVMSFVISPFMSKKAEV